MYFISPSLIVIINLQCCVLDKFLVTDYLSNLDKGNVKYSGNITCAFKTNGSESKKTLQLCHTPPSFSYRLPGRCEETLGLPCWYVTTGNKRDAGTQDSDVCLRQTFNHEEIPVPHAKRSRL